MVVDKLTGLIGFIDKQGILVIEPQFAVAPAILQNRAYYRDRQLYFSGGMARVLSLDLGPDPTDATKRITWRGYIDAQGNRAISADYDYIFDFHEGLAAVCIQEERLHCEYIDRTGNSVIVMAPGKQEVVIKGYQSGSDFSEGLAAVAAWECSDATDHDCVKYGYIDKAGKLVIPARFDGADRFSQGLAAVKVGGKYGYIDKTGKLVIQMPLPDAEYRSLGPFSEWLAVVQAGPWQFGYINIKGVMAINPVFKFAESFRGKLAKVRVRYQPKDQDGCIKQAYINRAGKIVWESEVCLPDSFGNMSP
jgi:hypothetical protein